MRRFIALGCAAMAVVTALIGGATAPAGAAYPGPNGRILFDRCDRRCQIWTVNPDGSGLEKVTTEGQNFLGDWSPDGTRIVYVSTRSGDLALWIANADGADAVQLTPNRNVTDPLWPRFTPDGRRVLYADCYGFDCDGGIYSVRIDGTHRHPVTQHSGDSYNEAELSPNAHRMAYMRWHVDWVKIAVYVSRPDGARERRVTPPRLEASFPTWSPSGEELLVTTNVFFDRPNVRLYSVRPDGSELTLLTDDGFRINDWDGAYSPDGTQIVFDSDRYSGCYGCGDLYVMNVDGSARHRIPLPFGAYDARWGSAPISTAASERVAVAPRVAPATPFFPWREMVDPAVG